MWWDLNDSSLPEVVSRLRAIPGNELMSLKNPLEEMRRIRHGEDGHRGGNNSQSADSRPGSALISTFCKRKAEGEGA